MQLLIIQRQTTVCGCGLLSAYIYLPRPQSLSKGGEENEKKFFVGRAKNNGKAKEREASLPIFQYPIMHCPAMISQPLIYIVCNCTALCPTKGLRRRQYIYSHLIAYIILVPRALLTRGQPSATRGSGQIQTGYHKNMVSG